MTYLPGDKILVDFLDDSEAMVMAVGNKLIPFFPVRPEMIPYFVVDSKGIEMSINVKWTYLISRKQPRKSVRST